MPKYRITDHTTGKKYIITGDTMPSDTEIEDRLSLLRQQDKAKSTPAVPPVSSQPVQKNFELNKRLAELDEMYFPRLMNKERPQTTGKKAVNTILDLASLPFRIGAGAVGTGSELVGWMSGGGKMKDFELNKRLAENVAMTGAEKNAPIGESLLRSPANIVPGMGAGKLISKIPAVAAKASPLVERTLSNLLMGGASAGINQAERYGMGQKPSVKQAALETGLAGVVPGGAKALKKVLGAASEKIMSVAVKPKPSFANKNAISFQKAFEQGIRPGVWGTGHPLEKISEGLGKRFKDLEGQMKGVMKDADESGKMIDLYEDVLERIPQKINSNNRLMPIADAVQRQYENMLTNLGNNKTFGKLVLKPSEALELKRVVGREGSWVSAYNKNGELNTKIDPDISAREIVYNELYNAINDKLKKVTTPKFQEINKQFQELIPVEKAVSWRLSQARNNEVLSLSDLLYGTALGSAAGFSQTTPNEAFREMGGGNFSSLLPLAGGIAVSRGLRSPRSASLLNRASTQTVSPRMGALGRQLMQNQLFRPREQE